MKRLVPFVALLMMTTAACARYEPVMGPFDGTIVDAVTGKPIADAFVGFVWNGRIRLLGTQHKCVHALLVRSDRDGHYAVPKQLWDFDTSQLSDIGWSQEAWAPGYLLAEAMPADAHGGAKLYSHQPGIRYEDGVDQSMRDHNVRVTAQGMKIRLYPSASAIDALASHNRMQLINYYCGASEPVLAHLAKALYQDSFKRVCVEKLPAKALKMRYVLAPSRDFSNYVVRDPGEAGTPQSTSDEWKTFNRVVGLDPPPIGSDANALPLKLELLPELCRLSSSIPGTAKETP